MITFKHFSPWSSFLAISSSAFVGVFCAMASDWLSGGAALFILVVVGLMLAMVISYYVGCHAHMPKQLITSTYWAILAMLPLAIIPGIYIYGFSVTPHAYRWLVSAAFTAFGIPYLAVAAYLHSGLWGSIFAHSQADQQDAVRGG